MKLIVLVDNNTFIDEYYLGEPGLSFYIEDGDKRILFDTGYSDIFIKNAKQMGIDLSTISTIAISHGHDDHTKGLKYLLNELDLSQVQLIAHNETFKPKYYGDLFIGSPITAEQLKNRCLMRLSKDPIKLSKNITFLGQIPRVFDFEPKREIGYKITGNGQEPDFLDDDTALVYQSKNGLFIITGCSHSGICNIIEYAKHLFNDDRIIGVIGGFHLKKISPQLHSTIAYFKQNNIQKLYPCHCVSFVAKAEIHKAIPIEEVGVSLTLEVE